MSAEILGGGMQNEIGAQIEGSLKYRRPGIVANAKRAGVVQNFRRGGEIDNSQQRIGRRFHPDQLRIRSQRFFYCCEVAHIDEIGLQTPATENFAKQTSCAVVGVNVRENVIGGRERLKNRPGRASS